MPYKSEKIKIAGGKYDRRIKLTKEDKEEIKRLREKGLSMRKLASLFGVSKRLVQFTVHPEVLERNKELRKARGGWKQYYVKEENTKAVAKTRNYKHKLYKEGLI